MTGRAKYPTPLTLRIIPNKVAGLYDVHENGITYTMNLEVTRELKEYFMHFPSGHKAHYPTMARWYADLKNEVKKTGVRSGNVPPEPIDFFPDVEYGD